MKQVLLTFLIRTLRRCAQKYLEKTKPYLIGVTGSVGKTSCRLIVAETLKKLLPQEVIYTSPKNYNSDVGLSLSILGIESYRPTIDGAITVLVEGLKKALFPGWPNPSLLVLEYGIDKPGDMDELLTIAVPDIAIFTSIDLVHAANFPDGKQGIYNEKIKLFKAAKDTLFVGSEVKNGEFAVDLETVAQGKTTIEFGEKQWEGQISFSDYKISVSWSKITSSFLYIIKDEKLLITGNNVGKYNISYLCVGITIADIIAHRKAYPNLWTLQTLQLNITLQPGRFSLFGTTRDDIIVDSTYNAAPGSMRKIIQETLSLQQGFFPNYKVICVLGEMRELGETSKVEHVELAKRLMDKVDTIIGVSGDTVAMTDYLIGLEQQNKHIYWVERALESVDVVQNILAQDPTQKYFIIYKSSQWEIWLEEAIKPFIDPLYRPELPRQDSYWLSKKDFVKKRFLPST